MWNELQIERMTREALREELGEAEGDQVWGDYTSARRDVVWEILPQIVVAEPNLSDHGAPHIKNVFENAHRLLGNSIEKLKAMDLYCLGLIILFHDVGNVFGRNDHHKRIAEVYNHVRGDHTRFRQERNIVTIAGGAHTGESSDGSKNTLKDLDPRSHLHGLPVRLRDLSAILRFADELAEGPQRTSRFMQLYHNYPPDSMIYHTYANVTQVFIDRGNERIALTYNIELGETGWWEDRLKRTELQRLLEFIFKRIEKLDQERKYAKHYCDLLAPFKRTTVKLNFTTSGIPCPLDLEEMTLSDVVVPGETTKPFTSLFPRCEVNALLNELAALTETTTPDTESST